MGWWSGHARGQGGAGRGRRVGGATARISRGLARASAGRARTAPKGGWLAVGMQTMHSTPALNLPPAHGGQPVRVFLHTQWWVRSVQGRSAAHLRAR